MVAVIVCRHRERIHGIGAAVRLLRVQPAVAVIVSVGVVTYSIAIEVRVLSSIVREGVVSVRSSVTVIVGVDLVAHASLS